MKKVNKILSNILQIDEDQISDETSPDNVETWDSFNHLMIISEIENQLEIKFTMDEVRQIKNVGDITAILNIHGVKLIKE
ncbi:MAG: acyl carrier protein [Nanoarchaeota archaeon]|nr:acyl carrier protein [Nanoarchaeota archaeon]